MPRANPKTRSKASSKTSSANPKTEAPSKRTAQAERKRRRLLDAAIEVLLRDGMAKFTSAHIAEAAGLHKPAFYSVFKSADECLEAVAYHLGTTNVREVLAQQTKQIEQGKVEPGRVPVDFRDRGRKIAGQMLNAVAQQKPVYRLLLRFRQQEGALGDAVREIDAYVKARCEERFWRMAVLHGVDASHFREVGQMAHFIVSLNYESAARVLDGTVTDLAAEADRLSRYVQAIVINEFSRMLAERDTSA